MQHFRKPNLIDPTPKCSVCLRVPWIDNFFLFFLLLLLQFFLLITEYLSLLFFCSFLLLLFFFLFHNSLELLQITAIFLYLLNCECDVFFNSSAVCKEVSLYHSLSPFLLLSFFFFFFFFFCCPLQILSLFAPFLLLAAAYSVTRKNILFLHFASFISILFAAGTVSLPYVQNDLFSSSSSTAAAAPLILLKRFLSFFFCCYCCCSLPTDEVFDSDIFCCCLFNSFFVLVLLISSNYLSIYLSIYLFIHNYGNKERIIKYMEDLSIYLSIFSY
ncbi:unnamed protein product [Acanthosepion pharaonis]|uniref:Uncharacterized protein n=1 Tax=Acanthosepion pharaonis TaxID=158019 RepID=A0A812DFP8_ACAPH|nr:unnamed protein product [Sepia pharaonis]